MLIPNLDQLNEAAVRKLCEDRCPESDTLDFKRDLPGVGEKDKHELQKDVCSLANADGGDLVYGIEDREGAAEKLKPLADEPFDAAKRRILQVLDAGLDPRVQGIRIHHVDVYNGYILIIRVPASFDGPHCVRIDNKRRFVMRNGTGTSDLTFDQLRAAFDRTATLAERARRFIDNRLQLLIARKTPKPITAGPISTVHLIPIAGLAGRQTVDVRALDGKGFEQFAHREWRGFNRAFNLDGLIVHSSGSPTDGYDGYTQVFRTGAMEAASLAGYKYQPRTGDTERCIVPSLTMSYFYRDSVEAFIRAAKEWDFAGPAVLGFALLHVDGYEFGIGDNFRPFNRPTTDREHLILPDYWLEDLDTACVDGVVRPMLDILWQAFGAERCQDFDDTTGNFNPRRG